jgi:UDP-N-acetylglucosamine 1-carboxyvinyltransferase
MVTILFSGVLMKKITIYGGNSLNGIINVSGSKNAALPIIFACILTKGISEIRNLPDIGDTRVALKLLVSFGANITRRGEVTYVDTTHLFYSSPDEFLVSKIRASTYLLGSCLPRFGRCPLLPFGGCNFAKRPIDMHIDACLALGGRLQDGEITAERLVGGKIVFDKKSVGATVNAILLASTAEGKTIICGGASEPHIDSLIDFLNSCGAEIKKINDELHIVGKELHGGDISIIGDMIEAGSYIAAGLITGGRVGLTSCPIEDMDAIIDSLKEFGVEIETTDNIITASFCKEPSNVSILANPYPGFPTDLHPIFSALLAAFSGGVITDNVWQTRFGYLNQLSSFGVRYDLVGNSAKIYPSTIKNAIATAPDLRGGMACLLLALRATGRSEIYSAETILRGYENLEEKLLAIGADIKIENT